MSIEEDTTDVWEAQHIHGEWCVTDENRLTVAACGDRKDDAEQIANDHNLAYQLLRVIRRIVECDLSGVRSDYNGKLLDAIADAHDLLARMEAA